MRIRAPSAKVPKIRGEFFRKILVEEQLIDNKLVIHHNDRYLYIPLSTQPTEQWQSKFPELDIITYEFESYPMRKSDYKEYLQVPKGIFDHLPSSYDIIGSIAILKLTEPVVSIRNEIGQAIIKTHKNIKTVAWDRGVKGDLRLRELEIIAGENQTETIHKEYNIRLLLDVSKVYFSPRLSSEHFRISQLVQEGELVLDMFAGVGPFSIMIAKYSKAERIYSIDLNKFAIRYLIRNIDQNKVTNVFPLEGDVRLLIRKIPKVNRIIMNLPIGAKEYLPEAFSVLKRKGIIHYHEMLKVDEVEMRKNWLEREAKQNNFEIKSIIVQNLGSYSPKINHYCFDLETM